MQCAKIRTLAEPFDTVDPRTEQPVQLPPWTVGSVPIEHAIAGQAAGKLQMIAGLSPEAIIQKPESDPEPIAPAPPPDLPARRTYKRRDILPEKASAAVLTSFMNDYLDPAFIAPTFEPEPEPEPEAQLQADITSSDEQDPA